MKRERWAPVAAVAAVLAVVGAVSLLGRGTTEPPVLRLASGAAPLADASSSESRSAGFRLVGSLPPGPAEARVRDLPAGAASKGRVTALADALGVDGSPTRADRGWRVADLVVSDGPGNPWTWNGCGPDIAVAPDTPMSSDGGTTTCYSPGSSGSGSGSSGSCSSANGLTGCVTSVPPMITSVQPPPASDLPALAPAPSATASVGCLRDAKCSGAPETCPSPAKGAPEVDCPYLPLPHPVQTAPGTKPAPPSLLPSKALAAAEPVLRALGLDDAATRVEGLSVLAEPVVAGLPTAGSATVLQLSDKAAVVGGSGWLSDGRDGASYPLRSAKDAFDALPVLAMGAPCDVVKGCPTAPAITGARLGLSRTDLADGEAALVPAWLYTVEGSPVPLVALAVQDRFLGQPGQTEPGGGTEPGGSDPGQVEPAPPPVDPAPGAPAPGTPGSEPATMPASYAVADGGLTLTTVFTRGVCPDEDWDLRVVEESADRVVLTVAVPAPPPIAAGAEPVLCVAMAKLQPDSVNLKAPLGDREVVDASGRPVPRAPATP